MKSLFRFLTLLFFVGLILLAFLFAVKNTMPVSLWLGITLPEYSVGIIVIATFILGGILGLLLGLGIFRQLKYRIKIRQLQSRLEKIEKSSDSKIGSAGRS